MSKIYFSETHRDCWKKDIGCCYLDGYLERKQDIRDGVAFVGTVLLVLGVVYFLAQFGFLWN